MRISLLLGAGITGIGMWCLIFWGISLSQLDPIGTLGNWGLFLTVGGVFSLVLSSAKKGR